MQHSFQIAAAINTAKLNRGLDGADWVADNRNVAFVEGPDVVLFDFDSDGVFEIHVLMSSRGKAARECINRAFDMMFRDRGAKLVFGMVPEHRREVAVMARLCGMKFIQKLNHRGDPVALYERTRDQWENEQ